MGVPTAGQYRERDTTHEATRSDGSKAQFNGVTKCFDLRIPAVPGIAELVGCKPIAKKNWLEVEGKQTRILARYSGSAPDYRARCDEVAAKGYDELRLG